MAPPGGGTNHNENLRAGDFLFSRGRQRRSLDSPETLPTRGKVRGRVNERRRCNLRFAVRTSGATNARTEGDTACEREDHRARRGVKGGVGDAGSVRAAGRAEYIACVTCCRR